MVNFSIYRLAIRSGFQPIDFSSNLVSLDKISKLDNYFANLCIENDFFFQSIDWQEFGLANSYIEKKSFLPIHILKKNPCQSIDWK